MEAVASVNLGSSHLPRTQPESGIATYITILYNLFYN